MKVKARNYNPISSTDDINNIDTFDVNSLDYVFRAVEETKNLIPTNLH